MKKYVNRQGYNVSFSSLMSWGKIKFDRGKISCAGGQTHRVVFVRYTSTTITTDEGFDILNYESTTGNHAAAGFGCLEVNYTFSDNSTRTDRYIHCAMGTGVYQNGYINVGNVNIDEVLAITIS